MNNPEILTTLDTQNTGQRQTKKEKKKTTQKIKKMSNMDPI
jgi:hypothetical protein